MIQRIKNSAFIKAVLLLSTGSVLAQGIRAIATPILTRIYSVESMGVYTYLISISAIFMGIANLRYEIPIVTDKDESHVFPLIKLSFIIGVSLTLCSSIGFGFYFFQNGKPIIWSVLIFFNVLAYAITNVLTAYNNRNKEYKLISSMYVIRVGVQYILAILLGLFNPIALFLLVPYVLGEYMGITRQMKSLKGHIGEIARIETPEIKTVGRLHLKQPLFSMPALLANSLSYSLITIFIERLFGLESVGYYSISVSLLGLPLAVIGGNISKVFMQNASNEYSKSGIFKHTFDKTFLILLGIAIPMVLVMYFFSTPLCQLIFGKEWGQSGKFIMILAPMFGIRFITSALSPAFTIVKKQQVELILQGVFLLSNISSYILSKQYGLGIEGFLTSISILFTFSYLLYLFFIFIFSRKIINQNNTES